MLNPIKMKHLSYPEWKDVEEFCTWYFENDMPFRPPTDTEVFLSDDATAMCLFRHEQYQVELYLIHPEPVVQLHEHPNVEVIKVYIDNDIGCYVPTEVLYNGQHHGAGMQVTAATKGFPLIAVQKWVKGSPTTVAAAWRGKTAGQLHNDLIKRFYPSAFNIKGYADITKSMDYLKELQSAKNT